MTDLRQPPGVLGTDAQGVPHLELVRPGLPSEHDVCTHGALVVAELERLARLQIAFSNLAGLAQDMAADALRITQEALDAANAMRELREQHDGPGTAA